MARPDPGELRGVGKALRDAYPPQPIIAPSIAEQVIDLDERYLPDAIADARFEQLLERLKQLRWSPDSTDGD